jgi:ABC-2 type transport system permease protein
MFLWIFPGSNNLLDSGYASLEALFIIAPWIFLFLVPAITMRMFTDERKSGTIETLFTRPLTDLKIISAKSLAAFILVLFSLIPTLIYFYSVYKLGNPVGSIDSGGTWGSYIGLFFLSAIYVAIGIFASSITENQIVAFIIGMFLCFLMFMGFDYLSELAFLSKIDSFVINMGINEHYKSLSRGVIDSRDIIYFISVVVIFTLFTKLILQSRKW